ncbi:MAG: hypothetical protein QF554_07795 [Dehalococcoidia bacterium]|jgi:hypothetical protein|nr:hypothetical protein [Dehalococcoidia bacterium]
MASEELGRIDKPDATPVIGKRKVYLITMVSPLPGAPEGFTTRLKNYWDAIDKNVSQLEARAGMVNRIFHEAVSVSGDLGLNLVSQVNQPAWSMIKNRMDSGATLEAFDNDDLFSQIVDWSRCAQVGLTSQAVADVIQAKYTEAAEARYAGMSENLEEKLGDSEAAIVIISSARGVTMPEGAEQFNVMPPELDELVRWTREASEQAMAQAQAQQQAAAAGVEPGHEGHSHGPQGEPEEGGSGLWTPGSG